MITYINENIFNMKCEAYINPVNCVGVMGKGLALEFKKRYPNDYFEKYKYMCDNNLLFPGELHLWKTNINYPKYIINFATKFHWKEPSNYLYIRTGLRNLKNIIFCYEILSVAIPKIGCGLGRLNWNEVKKIIEQELFNVNCDIYVLEF